MVQIPTRENLGQARVNGRATPAQIDPKVAYDIGRAGAAMDRAMSEIAAAFAGIGAKQQAMDDATWLAEAKIRTLEADDAIRRDTELNAGEDGTGFEQAPTRFKGAVDEVKKRPGGSQEARAKYELWSAEQGYETGRWAANTAQKRLHESTLGKLDKRLDTLSALSSANPERAEEYLSAYEEEINGYVGSAITASDAKDRIDNARSTIGKASIVSRALKNPADFGKALKAVEGAGRPDIVDTETRGLGQQKQEAGPAFGVSGGTLSFLRKEEGFTHKAKWDYAQHSIGYGTKAKFPGERISRQEAEARLRDETQKVSDFIDK
ncbi:MAG TPA: hypothetical protein VFW62_00035, partial [bacterium]|nr:hypothetical protein [bacterium]